MGTFANRTIHRGEFIMQLQGQRCSLGQLDQACQQTKTLPDDALQIDHDEYLILRYEYKVINHSCQPNACFRNSSDVYALRDINPGEEITCDYSTTVGLEDDWEMQCNCGSTNCRKNLGNILTLPATLREFYLQQNAVPDFIKQQIKMIKHDMLTTTKISK